MATNGAFSDYLEEAIINHFLRGQAQIAPSKVYIGLFETDAGEDGSGTETTYTGYERQESEWGAPSGGKTVNDAVITFPQNQDAQPVTISHIALFDAQTGGNQLFRAQLLSARTLEQGDSLAFDAGAVELQVD